MEAELGDQEWQFAVKQLHQDFREHANLDETRFSGVSKDLTEIKVDVAGVKRTLYIVGVGVSVAIPLISQIVTAGARRLFGP